MHQRRALNLKMEKVEDLEPDVLWSKKHCEKRVKDAIRKGADLSAIDLAILYHIGDQKYVLQTRKRLEGAGQTKYSALFDVYTIVRSSGSRKMYQMRRPEDVQLPQDVRDFFNGRLHNVTVPSANANELAGGDATSKDVKRKRTVVRGTPPVSFDYSDESSSEPELMLLPTEDDQVLIGHVRKDPRGANRLVCARLRGSDGALEVNAISVTFDNKTRRYEWVHEDTQGLNARLATGETIKLGDGTDEGHVGWFNNNVKLLEPKFAPTDDNGFHELWRHVFLRLQEEGVTGV